MSRTKGDNFKRNIFILILRSSASSILKKQPLPLGSLHHSPDPSSSFEIQSYLGKSYYGAGFLIPPKPSPLLVVLIFFAEACSFYLLLLIVLPRGTAPPLALLIGLLTGFLAGFLGILPPLYFNVLPPFPIGMILSFFWVYV